MIYVSLLFGASDEGEESKKRLPMRLPFGDINHGLGRAHITLYTIQTAFNIGILVLFHSLDHTSHGDAAHFALGCKIVGNCEIYQRYPSRQVPTIVMG